MVNERRTTFQRCEIYYWWQVAFDVKVRQWSSHVIDCTFWCQSMCEQIWNEGPTRGLQNPYLPANCQSLLRNHERCKHKLVAYSKCTNVVKLRSSAFRKTGKETICSKDSKSLPCFARLRRIWKNVYSRVLLLIIWDGLLCERCWC